MSQTDRYAAEVLAWRQIGDVHVAAADATGVLGASRPPRAEDTGGVRRLFLGMVSTGAAARIFGSAPRRSPG